MRVTVARTEDVAEGSLLGVEAGGVPLCVAHTAAGFYAVSDNCTHEDCPLSDGELDGSTVECPCHGSRFDVRTGEVLNPPAVVDVETYPVDVAGGDVVVTLPSE